jgi:hypothetical protein
MGSEAGFQPAQEFLNGKKCMPLESFYTRYIVRPAERLIRSAALLEYPQEYLDLILEKTVDHHYGNWRKTIMKCGDDKKDFSAGVISKSFSRIGALRISMSTLCPDLGRRNYSGKLP